MQLDLLESRRLLAGTGVISGAVYTDLNVNGVHEFGEAGIRRARVYLDSNNNGRWDESSERSALTDKRGHFAFDELAAGTYRLRQVTDGNVAIVAPRSDWFRVTLREGQQVTRRLFGNGLRATLPQGIPALADSDVLVKYTYFGDSDFSGTVNYNDYAKIDTSFNANSSGWFNGDFDYNGVVNFDDYSLIDEAFLTQTSVADWQTQLVAVPTSTPPTPSELPNAKSIAKADFKLTHNDHSLLPAKAWLRGQKNQQRTSGLQTVIDHYHQFGIDYKRELLRLAKTY